MSDAFWIAFFGCIVSVCTIISTIFTAKLKGVVVTAAQAADKKVDQVASALAASNTQTDAKLSEIQKTGIDTHTLVNSNMGAQLKIASVALRRIAKMTKDPEDIKAAELAEALLQEHLIKQGVVDSGIKTNGK